MSYDLKKDKSGKFTFNLKAGNGQVILTGQSYASKQGAQDGIASVRTHGVDDANFELKTSVAGEPFFVLKPRMARSSARAKCTAPRGLATMEWLQSRITVPPPRSMT
nr:YegP family protein [Verrucomicrobium spinosum]